MPSFFGVIQKEGRDPSTWGEWKHLLGFNDIEHACFEVSSKWMLKEHEF
jgi:hypothetical protein